MKENEGNLQVKLEHKRADIPMEGFPLIWFGGRAEKKKEKGGEGTLNKSNPGWFLGLFLFSNS